ncbi:MAG: Sec-independent protein translocase protein TatB [Gammaproteobacteria bacterium]
MFDIGFWEIVVVGVVALLVIGPKDLPAMIRTVGKWTGKMRHFANAVKTEIEREAYKADELKRLLAEQTELVERYKNVDTTKPAVPVVQHADNPGVTVTANIINTASADQTLTAISQADNASKTPT